VRCFALHEGAQPPLTLLPVAGLQDSRRYDVFKNNVQQIIADNKNSKNHHWSGLTPYTAMTWNEFKGKMLGSGGMLATAGGTPNTTTLSLQATGNTLGAPANWDWRTANGGRVTPVKDQGNVRLVTLSMQH
jgi:hypothetical protein